MTQKPLRIIFFGSSSDSVIVLSKLFHFTTHYPPLTTHHLQLTTIITQPPRPIGRKQIITKTPVQIFGNEHNIPVIAFPSNREKPWVFDNEAIVIKTITELHPDLIITACYGQMIPINTLNIPMGGINVHPSLLPRWRGGDPVPWAICSGDREVGVSVVRLNEKFDAGDIITQKSMVLPDNALPDSIRSELFHIGADLLISAMLNDKIRAAGKAFGGARQTSNQYQHQNQNNTNILMNTNDTNNQFTHHSLLTTHNSLPTTHNPHPTYARRFIREDGFVPWKIIQDGIDGKTIGELTKLEMEQFDSLRIVLELQKQGIAFQSSDSLAVWLERWVRGLTPWPGMFTTFEVRPACRRGRSSKFEEQKYIPKEKRLKILSAHVNEEQKLILDTVQWEGGKPIKWNIISKFK